MKASPLLQVSVRRSGDITTLALAGELDCSTAAQLETALHDVITDRRRPVRIVVDVGRISFVDVAGLNPLIQAARQHGGPGIIQLRNTGQALSRVIRLLDLAEVLGLDA